VPLNPLRDAYQNLLNTNDIWGDLSMENP